MANYPLAPDGPFGFHLQQSLEKLLKALLSQLGIEYPRTHDLESLLIMVQSAGETLPTTPIPFPQIQGFAVVHRYDDIPEYAVLDRTQALETLRILRKHVTERITILSTVP
jgi:HEPN domain-containing protein